MWYKYNTWLVVMGILGVMGCSKAFWLADPFLERYYITHPPQNINVTTEPQGARVVIASLRKSHIYAGYAPVNIHFRPHPHIPSWILVAKAGYKSTAIRIEEKATSTNLHVVLALAEDGDFPQDDIMGGPMLGRPARPMAGVGKRIAPPF